MERRDNPSLDQLGIRTGELESRVRLLGRQLDLIIPTSSINAAMDFGKLRESAGQAYTDFAWSKALFNVIETGEITPETALKIWDLKDEASRNLKYR